MARRPETTRALLLQSARREFVDHGLAGARVDRIAARAGVNKQRIYAHFGDKEQLFRHVLDEAVVELAAEVALTEDTDPVAYVGRVFDYHRHHPDLLRLLMWEALQHGDAGIDDDRRRVDHYDAKVTSLRGALGGDRDPADVRALLLTLIGLASWPQVLPQLGRLVLGPEASTEQTQAHLRAFLTEFTRAALQDGPDRTDRPAVPPSHEA
ncbi:TetR/AcrR family transcriptional regulator [Nocardiopsis aegyptia]|uniref:AcrR family transcriptional regulator n=1 Tax=Nocardiopsis aegyptia TaxID=220378 RepID=A0A7Z0EKL2_9ACTN|nr:TetR family transcriptional regulator [Nocardiopsis aegyptia]NYJ33817.1 AcrR family transcriptional regulator [Nocardiopsis aegyptia]